MFSLILVLLFINLAIFLNFKKFAEIINVYDAPDAGGILDSRPFKCSCFFHPLYVTAWKVHDLNITKGGGHANRYFVCKSGICDKYTYLYNYDWNLNGSVTKSRVNKRHNNDDIRNSVTSFSVRGPKIINFRDQQEVSLNYYSERYLKVQLKFQEFMRQDNNILNTPLVSSR